ncbi:MAG: hypothetical protein AABX25_04660 [Nanoarchaeota archaeon]
MVYQTRIYESTKAISDYMQQQQLDDISVTQNILQQKNILGDDPLSISRNFNNVILNFRLYLIYTFIILIIFIPLLWTLSGKLFGHINLKHFLRNIIVVFCYLILIFIFFYSITNISFSEAALSSGFVLKYLIFLIAAIVLFYFMFISLSLAKNTQLKNILPKTLRVGIKKIHYMLAVYLINLILVILSLFLLIYFIEKNFAVVASSILLFIFSFIFRRIFMLRVVNKLENL